MRRGYERIACVDVAHVERDRRRAVDAERVETIGDFEIIESKSDPMEDKIIVSPTPGQVEEMRLEIKGKAEETRIAAKLIPAKGKKATRPLIRRKTNP